MVIVLLHIFKKKNAKRKCTMQVIINNNARLLLKQRKSVILKHFWKNANMNQKIYKNGEPY